MTESLVDARQAVAVSSVDITGVTATAHADALTYHDTDPAYAELMATYAALGELLDTDPDPAECATLLRHATAVTATVDYHAGQRWARWLVQHTTFEGGA